MKKAIAVFLCIMLTTGMISGCAERKQEPETTQEDTAAEDTQDAQGESEEEQSESSDQEAQEENKQEESSTDTKEQENQEEGENCHSPGCRRNPDPEYLSGQETAGPVLHGQQKL